MKVKIREQAPKKAPRLKIYKNFVEKVKEDRRSRHSEKKDWIEEFYERISTEEDESDEYE